jgi:cytochrome c-type biogenesis protein
MSVQASAVELIVHGSPWAWAAVFAAGVASSLGPCASPRIVALAALVVRSGRPLVVGTAFLSSLVGTYAGIGFAGGALGDLVRSASWVYAIVALAGVVGGVVTLVGGIGEHGGVHAVHELDVTNAISAAVLSGIGFALMVSPCCTPVLGIVLTYTSARGEAALGAGLLAVYGLGHAAPLVPVLVGGGGAAWRLASSVWSDAVRVAAGSCMIGLGGYYALLV